MRALFVAPYLPAPGAGGSARLLNIMERLSRDHELQLVAFAGADRSTENPYPGTVLPPVTETEPVRGLSGFARLFRARRELVPSFVRRHRVQAMTEAIATIAERFHPHVVQIETTEMAQYLGAFDRSAVRALDLPDVASRWFGRAAREGNRGARAMLMLELNRTRKYEKTMAQIADVVYVSSESERSFLRGLSGVDAIEIPNGVDTAAFAPMSDVPQEQNTILFIGSLASTANLEGMRWFVEEVYPLIRAEHPDVVLEHVGTPGEHPWPDAVQIRGRVPDVRPHLAAAALQIVPLQAGSGPRARILEALSMERPVVSTHVAAEGLGVKDREQLMLADEPDAFARAVLSVLRSPELGARLGKAGREHVVSRYDWNVLTARIAASWELAVSSRSRPSAGER